jgi:hypothetical protein
MRSQTGRFEAEHEALGGQPVRQEQVQGILIPVLGRGRNRQEQEW